MSRGTQGMLVLAIICFTSLGASMSREVQPRAESLNYCADLKPMRGNYAIVSSELFFGKWTEGPGTSDELPPPTNKTVYALETLRICSSGRAWSPTGTEASIVLKEISDWRNSTIKIYWDVPAFGSFTHQVFYNESEHTVIRRESQSEPGSHLFEYYLYKI